MRTEMWQQFKKFSSLLVLLTIQLPSQLGDDTVQFRETFFILRRLAFQSFFILLNKSQSFQLF